MPLTITRLCTARVMSTARLNSPPRPSSRARIASTAYSTTRWAAAVSPLQFCADSSGALASEERIQIPVTEASNPRYRKGRGPQTGVARLNIARPNTMGTRLGGFKAALAEGLQYLVGENVSISPAGEIKLRPVRQKLEARLRKLHAALAQQHLV